MDGSKSNALIIGGSIVLAGLLIAFGIYAVNANPNDRPSGGDTFVPTPLSKISLVSDADHIVGSKDARLIIVEYSDTECPFCQQFHETMNSVMNGYKDGADVAWVYRHFPLTGLHPKAPQEAHALECAGDLGGNEGFWNYTNELYRVTPSNNGLDLSTLPDIAEDVGLDREAFIACQESGKYRPLIENSYNEAVSVGATGTPFNVIILKEAMNAEVLKVIEEIQAGFRPDQLRISKDSTQISISGGLGEDVLQSFIDLLLNTVSATN